jgi:hypothetical protein
VQVEAVEAAEPVGEEAAAAHAFLVSDVVDWGGAVGRAGRLDVDDFLAGGDRVGNIGLTDAVEVGLLVGLSQNERVGVGFEDSRADGGRESRRGGNE